MENNNTETQTENSSAINYESEYKKIASDYAKIKEALSKSNSENAEYKKKERERLSEDEKKSLEFKELVESKNQIENELKQIKLEREFLSNGFSQEECDSLIKTNCSPKSISDIIKSRVEKALASEKANQVKTTTPQAPMGNGNTGAKKSGFESFQETTLKNNDIVKL